MSDVVICGGVWRKCRNFISISNNNTSIINKLKSFAFAEVIGVIIAFKLFSSVAFMVSFVTFCVVYKSLIRFNIVFGVCVCSIVYCSNELIVFN